MLAPVGLIVRPAGVVAHLLAVGANFAPSPWLAGLLGVAIGAAVVSALIVWRVRGTLNTLRHSKELLENILANSSDAIITLDTEGTVLMWNHGAERIYGWSANEMVGRSISLIIPEERRSHGELEEINRVLRVKGTLRDYETVRLTKEGRRVTVNISAHILRDPTGRVIGRWAIVRDITPLKEMQAQFVHRESLATVGELAAAVAHEIKNPLAGITGAMEIIARGLGASDGRREIIEEILLQLRRLDHTTNNLLIFAKPPTPIPAVTNVREAFTKVLAILKDGPQLDRATVECHVSPHATCYCDPYHLEQTLLNLILNAVQTGAEHPHVTCWYAPVPSERGEVAACTISFADNGRGIASELHDRIYRPFFTTKHKGSGLGLPITKKLVEANGGRIGFETEVGIGTTFTVTLPVHPNPLAGAPPSAPSQ